MNVLNQITGNRYKNNQDKIYQAAEQLLICFKDDKNGYLEAVKSSPNVLDEYTNVDMYIQFKRQLYQELGKNDYNKLYREIWLFQQDKESNKTSRIEQKVDDLGIEIKTTNEKLDGYKRNNESISYINKDIKYQNNKKENYIENWNNRLFLNIDNKERPITLADAFIMPDCNIFGSIKEIGISVNDKLDEIIKKFVESDKTSTMLIKGVPGMGKSSIISWIANEYKDDDRIIVLRFRDWNRIILEKSLLSAICNKIKCEEEELENKILILDGFDEMKALNIRDRLLNEFFVDIKDFENFKCIITSRPAYIDSDFFSYVVILNVFDLCRVKEFYRIITGNELVETRKIESNLAVLGIPVILYMAIISNVDISSNPTKPELYNRIFAEKGGIFDRFYDGRTEYSKGAQIIRNPENIKIYLDFLRNIAFKMFEKNELFLQEDDCKIPQLEFQGNVVSILEFPIKNLFESTENNIEFIHKSIYEYFVSEYIYYVIADGLKRDYDIEIKLAGALGSSLICGRLTPEILEYLDYSIKSRNLDEDLEKVYDAFKLMLRDGMTYYIGNHYKNVINCEMNIFENMLDIIHLEEKDYYICDDSIYPYLKYGRNNLNLKHMKISYSQNESEDKKTDLSGVSLSGSDLSGSVLSNINLSESDFRRTNLSTANLKNVDFRHSDLREANLCETILELTNLRNADLMSADLSRAFLYKASLRESNLKNAKLNGAELKEANLREADLRRADLTGADLTNADLLEANLEKTNLQGADLTGAIFDESQIQYLDSKYDMHNVKIFDVKSRKLQSYKEYLEKKSFKKEMEDSYSI